MLCVPAKLAGCRQIVLCTPPRADGTADPAVLYAARACGVDTVFKLGGAQAIAAMAFGTASVPRCDKLYGPGNAYVAAANRAQYAIKEYPLTPAAEEALYIMSQAYNALGMPELSDDAERVLKRNFPDSKFLDDIQDSENPSWWKFW